MLKIAKREVEIINLAFHGIAQCIIHEWKSGTVSRMGNPEEQILKQMPIEHSNCFISVFRFRYGSPSGNIDPAPGQKYKSGMEEEFLTAYRSWKVHKRPEIMVFKSIEPVPPVHLKDTSQKDLDSFFKEFSSDGQHPGLYKEYDSENSFREVFLQSILFYVLKAIEEPSHLRNRWTALAEVDTKSNPGRRISEDYAALRRISSGVRPFFMSMRS